MKKTFVYLTLASALLLPHLSANADSFNLETLGLRAGFDTERSVSLASYEIYAVNNTPWAWEIGQGTQLSIDFESAIGGLTGEGETSIYARLGPQLRLDFDTLPIRIVAATGPAFLSEDVFDKLDLGGNFQFFNSVGFDWLFAESWTFGYRYQHISNAGIHDKNPGLNFHTLSFSHAF